MATTAMAALASEIAYNATAAEFTAAVLVFGSVSVSGMLSAKTRRANVEAEGVDGQYTHEFLASATAFTAGTPKPHQAVTVDGATYVVTVCEFDAAGVRLELVESRA